MKNPYALYVNCDGAMDYKPGNPGGIGYVINFPDDIDMEPIKVSSGIYIGGNIERLELEALISAMKETLQTYQLYQEKLFKINTIIFITDRFALSDQERTSPYLIAKWRKNKWKTEDGKPIKNHKLLDELDKIRAKLTKIARSRVSIEFRRRKENKAADKLSKIGKREGLPIRKLAKMGEKIGKRKLDGAEIKYNALEAKSKLDIHVFRKDPVQDEWEVWVEIVEGNYKGSKIRIYTDDILASKLKRRNEFTITIKKVYKDHIRIYRTLKKKKSSEKK